MINKKFSNKRIGVLGKGGSGKSTITVLLANVLKSLGYTVCVLDADSTNYGIHQTFGFNQAPTSLIDYFGGDIFSGGEVSCPVDDPTPLPNANIDLTKIPNKYYSSDEEGLFLFQLGKIGGKGPGAGCDGPISKIARDLKVEGIGNQAVTLIDIKAGLEDSARGVITSMDWIITVVDPSTASFEIAKDIKNIVSQIKNGELPATAHLESPEFIEDAKKIYKEAKIKESFTILNKIKNKKTEKYISNILNEKELNIIGTIYEDDSISLSWLKGKPLKGVKAIEDMKKAVEKLERIVKEQEVKLLS